MRPIMGCLSDYTDVAPGSRAVIFMVNKSRRLFLPKETLRSMRISSRWGPGLAASFTLAAPASKSNVVQETGCVSENMSTILLVIPFTIST